MTRTPSALAILTAAALLAACGRGGETGPAPPAAEAASADSSASRADSTDGVRLAHGESHPPLALRISPGAPEYRFVLFETRPGVVDSIGVLAPGEAAPGQVLRPGENDVLPEAYPHPRLTAADLDLDGHADLALLAELGMANTWLDYWRFDPAERRFRELGRLPALQMDSARRELSTHVRGGHAGLLYESGRYRFVDGQLVQVYAEQQDWSEEAGRYVRVTSELRGGRLVETRRDTLAEEQAVEAVRSGG